MTTLEWIDRRFDEMLAAPGMWGSREAVELQVLLLLEARLVVTNGNTDGIAFLEHYKTFLRTECGMRYPFDWTVPYLAQRNELSEPQFVLYMRG